MNQPYEPHNHQTCIRDAMDRAEALCAERGTRLTPLRKTVLKLVWRNHKPLGAYALMAMLEKADTRKVAPPTVYRALDFLLDEGLIHRVHTLNAYIGCPAPGRPHAGNLLICRECGVALEVESGVLDDALTEVTHGQRFTPEDHTLEVVGVCEQCGERP